VAINLPTVTLTGDGALGSWTTNAGATSNLYQCIDEGGDSPNDADYIKCANDVNNNRYYVSLSDMPADFGSLATIEVRFRYRMSAAAPANPDTYTLRADVWTSGAGSVCLATGAGATAQQIASGSSLPTSWTDSGWISIAVVNTPDNNKTKWNLAQLSIRQDWTINSTTDARHLEVSAVEVRGTYNPALSALVPTSDNTINGWRTYAEGSSNLYSFVDDPIASPVDTNDYIHAATDTNNSEIRLNISDMPTDFESMAAVNVTVRYCLNASPPGSNKDTYGLQAKIMAANGTTVLAAAASGGTYQSVVAATTTMPTTWTNSSQIGFAYVNTAATKSDWDGALLFLNQTYTAASTGDTHHIRVSSVEVGGGYVAGNAKSGGSEVILTYTTEQAGQKAGKGGATINIAIITEQLGHKTAAQGGSTINIAIPTEQSGKKSGRGSSEVAITIIQEGGGMRLRGGGSTINVAIITEQAGKKSSRNGSTLTIAIPTEQAGRKSAKGGAQLTIGIPVEGAGKTARSGASQINIAIVNEGAGRSTRRGGTTVNTAIITEQTGKKTGRGGAEVVISIVQEGAGRASLPGSGGSTAIINILCAAQGSKGGQGSSERSTVIVVEGAGIKRGRGGSTLTITIAVEGAGRVPPPPPPPVFKRRWDRHFYRNIP
jgi:hypothetical protein